MGNLLNYTNFVDVKDVQFIDLLATYFITILTILP